MPDGEEIKAVAVGKFCTTRNEISSYGWLPDAGQCIAGVPLVEAVGQFTVAFPLRCREMLKMGADIRRSEKLYFFTTSSGFLYFYFRRIHCQGQQTEVDT